MRQDLEEAINGIGGVHPDWDKITCFKIGFKEGAEWQKEQSPWISVEDSLPEENAGVFFIVEWKDSHKGYFVGLYCGDGYWESDYRMFATNFSLGRITHWMPIPKFNE